MNCQKVFSGALATSLCLLYAISAQAHFLWLTSEGGEGQAKAVLYFSESAHEQDYHLPEAMNGATVWQRLGDKKLHTLKMEQVDTDDLVGMAGDLEKEGTSILATTCDYGIYGGSLLSYYTKHIRCSNLKELGASGQVKELKLEMVPRLIDGTIEVSVLWEGKPKRDVDISVTELNEKTHSLKTDAQGRARYRPTVAGLVGMQAGFTDRSEKGDLDGKAYEGAAHYATLTFEVPTVEPFKSDENVSPEATEEAETVSEFPALPAGLASFGGAVHEGWLYVYSGHTGGAHDHSRDNLSQHFQRLKLDGGEAWEELPMQTPLQGLALVSHASGLYRIGGLNARNADGEDEDLHSTAEFAKYDPSTEEWTKLADLPEARSSLDAVVIGDKLYAAGGWRLAGDGDGEWLDTALVFDLTKPDGQWTALKAPFQRRALAVSHWQGKLVVLGGISDEGDISFDVHIFDPDTQAWTEGPKFPGQGMDGFGVSAWNLNGQLYACGLEGRINELASDGKSWKTEGTAQLETPRFFHQLLPRDSSSLIAVAGASTSGHLDQIESVTVQASDAE